MPKDSIDIHFDFVDPLSYLAALEWPDVVQGSGLRARWMPFELRPPPTPLVSVDDPSLAGRWEAAEVLAPTRGVRFVPPRLVPWTRKAHELMAHAVASGGDADALRRSLFEAYLVEGRDIGRVDVLVEIGRSAALDVTETKAVLDVDRYDAHVASARAVALDAGIDAPPALAWGDRVLRGFHNGNVLGTFLGT